MVWQSDNSFILKSWTVLYMNKYKESLWYTDKTYLEQKHWLKRERRKTEHDSCCI
jgi:hypothetical protein